MQKELYFAGSATKAVRVRNILRASGINAEIERTFDGVERGCGYSVLVIESSVNKAKEILKKHNIEAG